MKTIVSQHAALAAVAVALTLSAARAEVLIEDSFGSSDGRQSESVPVFDHKPTTGPTWDGTAKVEDGNGLIADLALEFSSAFSEINVPQDFKKLIVKIRYRPMNGSQFAFGFANTDAGLRRDFGYNRGLMWVNTSRNKATLHGGSYAEGGKVEKVTIPTSKPIPDLVEIEFEVENKDLPKIFYGRLVANGKELVSQEITATEPPTFRFFFIQFRGESGVTSQAVVERVSVEVQK